MHVTVIPVRHVPISSLQAQYPSLDVLQNGYRVRLFGGSTRRENEV